MTRQSRCIVSALVGLIMFPTLTFACACGCNVFTVGTRWTMPTSAGFSVSLQYNYMNQIRNWSNWQSAPADQNEDLAIRTNFYTLGIQYLADRDWGFMVETPIWNRFFKTTDDDGDIASVNHTSFGDIRLLGMYTGISDDMSVGLEFGLKLPTGAFHESLLDPDTQVGTGTTDLLLGAYKMGQENEWGWYVQVMWQHSLNTREEYRPGDNFDVNGGVHYDGMLSTFMIAPVLQLAGSFRGIDSGHKAESENTGYERLYISPGLQFVASHNLVFYADLKIPIVTHVRGVQLVAPALVNLAIGFRI